PEQARRIAEVQRQDRTDQRAGAGDGREVVAEQDPLVRRVVILAIVEPMRRRRVGIVQRCHLGSQERAIVPVRQSHDAQHAHQHRHGPQQRAAVLGLREQAGPKHRLISRDAASGYLREQRNAIRSRNSRGVNWSPRLSGMIDLLRADRSSMSVRRIFSTLPWLSTTVTKLSNVSPAIIPTRSLPSRVVMCHAVYAGAISLLGSKIDSTIFSRVAERPINVRSGPTLLPRESMR